MELDGHPVDVDFVGASNDIFAVDSEQGVLSVNHGSSALRRKPEGLHQIALSLFYFNILAGSRLFGHHGKGIGNGGIGEGHSGVACVDLPHYFRKRNGSIELKLNGIDAEFEGFYIIELSGKGNITQSQTGVYLVGLTVFEPEQFQRFLIVAYGSYGKPGAIGSKAKLIFVNGNIYNPILGIDDAKGLVHRRLKCIFKSCSSGLFCGDVFENLAVKGHYPYFSV